MSHEPEKSHHPEVATHSPLIAQAAPGKYLTLFLDGQEFAISILYVREINRICEITPVPQAPTCVSGVMNLRGKVVPVIDLRTLFERAKVAHSKQTCIVVVEGASGLVGVIVDSVAAVQEFRENQLDPSPQLNRNAQDRFVLGMARTESKVIIIVDIQACVSHLNWNQFENQAA